MSHTFKKKLSKRRNFSLVFFITMILFSIFQKWKLTDGTSVTKKTCTIFVQQKWWNYLFTQLFPNKETAHCFRSLWHPPEFCSLVPKSWWSSDCGWACSSCSPSSSCSCFTCSPLVCCCWSVSRSIRLAVPGLLGADPAVLLNPTIKKLKNINTKVTGI